MSWDSIRTEDVLGTTDDRKLDELRKINVKLDRQIEIMEKMVEVLEMIKRRM